VGRGRRRPEEERHPRRRWAGVSVSLPPCLWLGGKREEGLEVRVVDEEQRRGEAELAGQRPRV